jgi:hypothetical protein
MKDLQYDAVIVLDAGVNPYCTINEANKTRPEKATEL